MVPNQIATTVQKASEDVELAWGRIGSYGESGVHCKATELTDNNLRRHVVELGRPSLVSIILVIHSGTHRLAFVLKKIFAFVQSNVYDL